MRRANPFGAMHAIPRAQRDARRGFTLMEMVVVMALVGLMAAMIAPRLRVSSTQRVRAAAFQLQQDLDLVRTRALSTRSAVRVVFDAANGSYDAYLAERGSTTFAESAAEQDSMAVMRHRALPDGVTFGRAGAPDIPGFAGAGDITLPDERAEFDGRGMTRPFGTRGVLYLTHADDPRAMAAVAVTGGAAIRVYVYDGEAWK